MAFMQRRNLTPSLDGRRRYNHFVETYPIAGSFELSPDTRVFVCGLLGVRNNGTDSKTALR